MLRRRTPLQARRATQTPEERRARQEVRQRDNGKCIGPAAGLPGPCFGETQYDHIRASGALGKKSVWHVDNGASLCVSCHDWKTSHGPQGRALLIDYIESLKVPTFLSTFGAAGPHGEL